MLTAAAPPANLPFVPLISTKHDHPLRRTPWSKKIKIVGVAVCALMAVSVGIYGIVLWMSKYQVRRARACCAPPHATSHAKALRGAAAV